jgi:hypothetical protein
MNLNPVHFGISHLKELTRIVQCRNHIIGLYNSKEDERFLFCALGEKWKQEGKIPEGYQ